ALHRRSSLGAESREAALEAPERAPALALGRRGEVGPAFAREDVRADEGDERAMRAHQGAGSRGSFDVLRWSSRLVGDQRRELPRPLAADLELTGAQGATALDGGRRAHDRVGDVRRGKPGGAVEDDAPKSLEHRLARRAGTDRGDEPLLEQLHPTV